MEPSFYLGVWKSLTVISDEEAGRQYGVLRKIQAAADGFNAEVYAFYSRLIGLYPEIDLLSEDELDDSPWASSPEMSGTHVIMAIVAEKIEKVVPQILGLAEQHGLVCFDPQAGQVYLPPHLAAKQGGAGAPRTWSARSEPKRTDAETKWMPRAGEVVEVERNPGDFTPPDYVILEIASDGGNAKLQPLDAGRLIPNVYVVECCDRLRPGHNVQYESQRATGSSNR